MTGFERFLRRLIDLLEARDPTGVHRPISITDLRRTIMPYRLNRGAIGLTSADDYELLVLRLIAEEGGYARTYPGDSAELARAEVASPNPDLDLVERLGDTTVQIGAAGRSRIAAAIAADLEAEEVALADSVAAATAAERADRPRGTDAAAASGQGETPATATTVEMPIDDEPPVPASPGDHREPDAAAAVAETGSRKPAAPAPDPAPPFEPIADTITVDGPGESPIPPRSSPAPSACPACHAALPEHRVATFCPFCGHQVGSRQCTRCGSEIEPGWRHCIVCGQQAITGTFA